MRGVLSSRFGEARGSPDLGFSRGHEPTEKTVGAGRSYRSHFCPKPEPIELDRVLRLWPKKHGGFTPTLPASRSRGCAKTMPENADESNFVRLNLLDEARGASGDFASLRALDTEAGR